MPSAASSTIRTGAASVAAIDTVFPAIKDEAGLAAYVARAEARPAYKRAFAAQLATFQGKPPAD